MDFVGDLGLPLDSDGRLLLQEERHAALLLAHEWHRVQLVPPALRDFDGVILSGLARYSVPLGVGVVDDLLDLLRVQGVPDVVEVTLFTLSVLRKFVREVVGHSL